MLRKIPVPQLVYLLLYLIFIHFDWLSEYFDYSWFGVVVYIAMAILGLVLFWETWQSSWRKLDKKKAVVWFLLVLACYLILNIGLSILSQLLQELLGTADYQLINDSHVYQLAETVPRVIVVLTVTICGPIVEELTYRYLLFGWLRRYLPISIALVVQAIIFGMIHMHALTMLELVNVLPHMGSGLVLGWLYHKSDSLWLPTWLHMFSNGLLGIL